MKILGYVLAIDMTARNVQDEARRNGLPWDIAKGFDTFLPLSERIPKDRIADPHNVTLQLSVNGQVKQRDSTNLMLFRIPRLLSDISQVMALEAGDVVLTGTPKGVGPVAPGDVMSAFVEVDGREIGESKVEVVVSERGGLYEYSES
jgi:acylpyruvate hydrolase